MKIKMDTFINADLLTLKDFLQRKDTKWNNDNQELILTTLYLLLNDTFRNEIKRWRIQFHIPVKWVTNDSKKDEGQLWQDWLDKHPQAPNWPNHEEIINLCKLCKVDPRVYGEFILDYLYFNNIRIDKPANTLIHTFDEEYRYKAKLEVDYGDGLEFIEQAPNGKPQKVYIHVYSDTTKNKLITFIENNWSEIEQIKKLTDKYPHSKTYGSFKRDIQVFILSLLGYKAKQIGEMLIVENDEDFSLTDNDIYQTINDLSLRLKTYNS